MKSLPTTEERLWATLAHLSALAMGIGILLPVVAWSEQRRKSGYAAFQSLQALGYQSLGYTLWGLTAFLIVTVQVLLTMRELAGAVEQGVDPASFLGSLFAGHLSVTFGLIGLYFLPPLVGAVASAAGRDFRYPLLGGRLGRYLEDTGTGELIEEQEDRWVAAMGHFAVIIALWGMLVPLAAWILQGKRSAFLRFQSIQTLAYQATLTLLTLGAALLYAFGLVAFAAALGVNAGAELDTALTLQALAVLGVFLLLAIAILLIIPLFHIQGQWAGYRVLKGDNYRYPLLGRLVERRMAGTKPKPVSLDVGPA